MGWDGIVLCIARGEIWPGILFLFARSHRILIPYLSPWRFFFCRVWMGEFTIHYEP